MAFATLDYAKQVQHLQTLAEDALAAWYLPDHQPRLTVYANNAVFTVYHDDQPVAILRVGRPGHKKRPWIASELAWLRAIRAETAVRAPLPLREIYDGSLPGVAEAVHCVLFDYLPGHDLPAAEHTPAQVAQVGALMARLHRHALQFELPPGFERPRLDWEGLFGERSPYDPGAGAALIDAVGEAVLGEVAERVRAVMRQLDGPPDAFGLIHADLIYKNTLFTPGGEVAVIDFDDCGFGYFLYDLACPLLFYKPLPHYADLKDALWQGYTDVRPLPASARPHLETFIAGRYVAACRWVAGNAQHPSLRGKAADIIAGRIEELRGFLVSGAL